MSTRFLLRALALPVVLGLTPACQKPATMSPLDANAATHPSPDQSVADAPAKHASPVKPTILQQREDRVIAELPNRMILLAQSVPTAPVVSTQVWIKTGSLYEQEHVGAGLSHFLEHLISGGSTSTRPEAESTALLGSIGAATNAATSLDTVRYYINTTADNAPVAIDLLSDWMQNSLITEAEYERERDVIQREFSMGQGEPGRILWKMSQSARFADLPTHPGAHPTIGYLDEFLSISRDGIYDFYKRMYVPNNMIFVVVGDIDPQATIDQLAALWGDVPTGELPELSFPVSNKAYEPVTIEGVAAIKSPRVRLMWPGVKLGSEHDYALDLIGSVLGGGESSRLVRDLRDTQQLVTSIDAFNYSTSWGDGFFGIDYELANADAADAARTAISAQLDRLRVEPVTEAELARVKRQVLASVLKSGQSAEGLASSYASNMVSTADPDYYQRYAAKVQDITPDQLMAAANAILTPDDASTVCLNPAGPDDEIAYPTRPPAESLAASDLPTVPVDLDNYSLAKRLEANLQQPGTDVRAIAVDAPEVRTLENGLTVIVQRSTVVPAVSMQLYIKGGLLADAVGEEGKAYAAYSMLDRGTTTRSAQELAVAIEDLGASLGTGSGNNTSYVTASSLSEDWPTVMGIMADVLLHPAFAPDEWDRLRPRLLASIDRSTDSWSGELRARFREAYYPDHPWSQLTVGRREVVEKLTVDDLKSFYASNLDASDAVLAVVGDVDPEEVFKQAEGLFGAMPSTPDEALVLPQPTPPTPGLSIFETSKPVAAVTVGFGPGLTRDSADYAAVQVLSRVIGDFPGGWLQQELRGRGPGLVYASGAYASTGLVNGFFAMMFNTQPDTVDEALERTVAVAERARIELVDDQTLARAKAKVLTTEFFGRQTTSDLAAGQALDLLYGIDDLDGSAFLAQVESLTAEDIRTAAQKYLQDPVTVIISHDALDETAIKAILEK